MLRILSIAKKKKDFSQNSPPIFPQDFPCKFSASFRLWIFRKSHRAGHNFPHPGDFPLTSRKFSMRIFQSEDFLPSSFPHGGFSIRIFRLHGVRLHGGFSMRIFPQKKRPEFSERCVAGVMPLLSGSLRFCHHSGCRCCR